MRLLRLDLTRYGGFTDRVLDFGPATPGQPDLHIVHGPNEAGKSTLLNAWLDLLFGIGRTTSYNFLHPYPALQIGALLDLPGGTRELRRVKKDRDSLSDADGRPVPDTLLHGAMGGIDRASCADMFALDAMTMERGGDSILSSQGDLGQLLFSASAGLAELGQQLDRLREDADGFHRKGGRKTTLREHLAALDALTAERRGLDVLASDYRARRDALGLARAAHDEAAGARSRAVAARDAAKAALDALPWLAEWADVAAELAPLELLPDMAPGWDTAVPRLIEEQLRLRTETALNTQALTRIADELAALTPDPQALALADDPAFDEDLRVRFLAARDDLPRRLAELTRAEATAATLGERIAKGTVPTALRVDPAALDHLAELATAHEGLAAHLASARAEAEARADELAAAGGPLKDEGAEDRAIADLRAAMAPLHRADLALRRDQAAAALAEAVARRDAALARLAPWRGDADGLRTLAVPSAQRLAGWQARLDAATAARDTAARVKAERADDLRRRRAERDALADSIGPADPARAEALRAERDAAWAAHLAALDRDSADTFHGAMQAHDLALTAQIDRAAEIGRLYAARADAGAAERLARAADEGLAAAESALTDLRADLAAQVGAILPGCDPLDPLAELPGWLSRRDRALDLADEADAARRQSDRAKAEAAQAQDALAAALRATGQPAAGDLRQLTAEAERLLDRAGAESARRAERLRLTRELAARQRAKAARQRALDDWEQALARACAGSFLADAPPDAGRLRALIPLLRELGAALARAEELRHRTSAMQDDQAAFAAAVDRLAGALALPPDAPLARHAAAVARLAEARRIDAAQQALGDELARAKAIGAGLQQRRARLDAEAAAILPQLGASDLAGAQAALARIARRDELRRRAAWLSAQIRTALGTASVEEAAARLDPASADSLRETLARAESHCAEAEARLEPARQTLYRAQAALDDVPGDDRVALIEARRRALLLQIEDESRRWLRDRAGVIATDHALRSYRDRHRSGMLARASDVFAAITGGAYSGLTAQPGNGSERLIALTAEGGSKEPAMMSKGTRFQLYLALRIAGFHEWATAHGPVPVIADDIMETFDDARSARALAALSEVSRRCQVIYLTHHSHICDLAREHCPGARILSL
ncbi:YhaN family protein [Paracoccus alkenifer]|uniref:Uncharacterized protein YhaN n=1 Tax=Paracoccus alkenifer TaxID=65735 RepID=A0A1H6NDL6_9RHOB|nr:YhaN family protein [Paracoccus alkenifer]SEI08478.1 Uncharacterized protein YhaN [Paracoccus alkenifer]